MSRIVMAPTKKPKLAHARDELDKLIGHTFQWVNGSSPVHSGVCIKIVRKNESLLDAMPYGWNKCIADRSWRWDRVIIKDGERLFVVQVGQLHKLLEKRPYREIPNQPVVNVPKRHLLRRPS